MLVVNKSSVDEIKDLVETKDIDLDERRDTFENEKGRRTELNEEGLLVALALTDDDDDELFANNVEKVEQQGYRIATGSDAA